MYEYKHIFEISIVKIETAVTKPRLQLFVLVVPDVVELFLV